MRIWGTVALALWGCLLVYTGIVIGNRGPGLLPIFFGDMAAVLLGPDYTRTA